MRNGSKADAALASNPSDDICPVCKSNRYLNPSLQFLINPECYHKMCSTCVDRIFTSGPASCPVPYCGRTLRKRGFHKAFFADLKVEREVDIRKRVGAVFNRRQDEFETLLDWNNYLEEVEGLVFDIVEGNAEEKRVAEERLKAYKDSNLMDIEENRRAGLRDAEEAKRREGIEKEAVRQRRLAVLEEEREEKLDLAKTRRDVLDKLANTNEDAAKITAQAQKIILKKANARRNLLEQNTSESSGNEASRLTIRGLKQKKVAEPEKPYDPFGGMDFTPSRYVLQDVYNHEPLSQAKRNIEHMAGGYSMPEYYSRTLFEAFSGLAVFIEDETPDQTRAGTTSPSGSSMAAAEVSMGRIRLENKMDIDDVF